ncbi:MAG: hypothetical protein DMF12_09955 [Verrucomicrobia bacterium]|nr:MAG: hypothetical protein DMF12_09955 [Verrucomicrobiota bacterium]
MQSGCDGLGVFAQDARAFFDDLHHARIALGRRFKNHRRQHRDFHFVRRLHPANQFIQIVQRKRMQDFRGETDRAAMQIMFPQDQTKRLNGKKITAARVAQNVPPASSSLDSIAPASGD